MILFKRAPKCDHIWIETRTEYIPKMWGGYSYGWIGGYSVTGLICSKCHQTTSMREHEWQAIKKYEREAVKR